MSTMIDDLNLLDGSWYAADPHRIFDEMRRTAPVHYDPVGAVERMPVTFTPTAVEV